MSEQNERTVADAADENNDQLKQIKDEIGKKYDTSKLTINRVPDDTIQFIKDLSYEKAGGDYGMTLALLVENYKIKDKYDHQISQTQEKVLQLQEQVQSLRQDLIDEKSSDEEESKVNTIR